MLTNDVMTEKVGEPQPQTHMEFVCSYQIGYDVVVAFNMSANRDDLQGHETHKMD